MVNLAKWLIKKEKLKNITYRAARFAPAKNYQPRTQGSQGAPLSKMPHIWGRYGAIIFQKRGKYGAF